MVSFVKKTMVNKQIDMRRATRIYELYGEGDSKQRISKELGISCNTVAKYIEFFKCYRLTLYEVSEMTLEEIYRLLKAGQKPKNEQLRALERYFPYSDKELRKTGSRDIVAFSFLSVYCLLHNFYHKILSLRKGYY